MPTKKQSYTDISTELDSVLEQLQAEDIDVDVALELYRRGRALTEQLEARLQDAENTVRELQADR